MQNWKFYLCDVLDICYKKKSWLTETTVHMLTFNPDTILMILRQRALRCYIFSGESSKTSFIALDLTRANSSPPSTTLEASALAITTPICFLPLMYVWLNLNYETYYSCNSNSIQLQYNYMTVIHYY